MKFSIEWVEHVRMNCYVEIEASTKDEALKKFYRGEYEDYDREEYSNEFEPVLFGDIKEVKGEDKK